MSDEPIRHIALTESEVLLANLEALGLKSALASRPTEEHVLAEYSDFIGETGKIPTAEQIGFKLSVSATTVRACCRSLVKDGRMIRFKNAITGLPCFIPKVV